MASSIIWDKHDWHLGVHKMLVSWGDTWEFVEAPTNRKVPRGNLLEYGIHLCSKCLSPTKFVFHDERTMHIKRNLHHTLCNRVAKPQEHCGWMLGKVRFHHVSIAFNMWSNHIRDVSFWTWERKKERKKVSKLMCWLPSKHVIYLHAFLKCVM